MKDLIRDVGEVAKPHGSGCVGCPGILGLNGRIPFGFNAISTISIGARKMLTAYWDLGLQIKDLSIDDPRVPLFPFEKLDHAESMLARAKLARPEIVWEIKKQGDSYSVREKRP